MRAKHPLVEKHGKADATLVAPVPSEAAGGQTNSGNQKIVGAPLRPNTFCCCDARPKPPAEDYECGDKSNPFGKVPSRADKTPTFKALENSKRGN